MFAAIPANNRIVRIGTCRQSDIGWRARSSTAAAGIHGGKNLRSVLDHQPAGCRCGLRGSGIGLRWLAQELAMGGVAEMKVAMPPPGRPEIRSSGNGLRL